MLAIRDGGLAIYGGIIGAFLFGGLACKWRKVPMLPMFDPVSYTHLCKAFYAPNNMVLAAAGSTSMEQILAACARHGLMEARPVERVQRLWTCLLYTSRCV